MHRIYSIETFEEEKLACTCGWEGQGKDAVLEPQLLTDEIEIYCPACGHHLGIASADTNEEGLSLT